MKTTSVSAFKKDVKKYLDEVSDDFETVIIHRPNGREVVLMSIAEYNSVNATMHELSSKKNKARLDSAIKSFKSGKRIKRELIEL